MKKFYLLFAAAALMASCNGNSQAGENAASSDSIAAVAAESQEEAEPAAEVKTGPCTIESEDLSIDVPEGWTAEVGVFQEVTMTKQAENGAKIKIEASFIKGKTAAQYIEDYLSTYKSFSKGGDVKMGDRNYTTLRYETTQNYRAVADVENGMLEITTNYIAPEDPIVVAAVGSIKLK